VKWSVGQESPSTPAAKGHEHERSSRSRSRRAGCSKYQGTTIKVHSKADLHGSTGLTTARQADQRSKVKADGQPVGRRFNGPGARVKRPRPAWEKDTGSSRTLGSLWASRLRPSALPVPEEAGSTGRPPGMTLLDDGRATPTAHRWSTRSGGHDGKRYASRPWGPGTDVRSGSAARPGPRTDRRRASREQRHWAGQGTRSFVWGAGRPLRAAPTLSTWADPAAPGRARFPGRGARVEQRGRPRRRGRLIDTKTRRSTFTTAALRRPIRRSSYASTSSDLRRASHRADHPKAVAEPGRGPERRLAARVSLAERLARAAVRFRGKPFGARPRAGRRAAGPRFRGKLGEPEAVGGEADESWHRPGRSRRPRLRCWLGRTLAARGRSPGASGAKRGRRAGDDAACRSRRPSLWGRRRSFGGERRRRARVPDRPGTL